MTANPNQIKAEKWLISIDHKNALESRQSRIWTIHAELSGVSALFRNLDKSDFNDKEFYGISLVLERLASRLGKISDDLEKINSAITND